MKHLVIYPLQQSEKQKQFMDFYEIKLADINRRFQLGFL